MRATSKIIRVKELSGAIESEPCPKSAKIAATGIELPTLAYAEE